MSNEPATVLDAAWITARIPHAGSMCLLDAVTCWSEAMIECHATSQCRMDNPLRAGNRLGIACGIEYAAQAMAVHGALLAGQEEVPRAGYLTSVRDVQYHADRLDHLAHLSIRAEVISAEGGIKMYGFSILAEQSLVLTGRASVMTRVEVPQP